MNPIRWLWRAAGIALVSICAASAPVSGVAQAIDTEYVRALSTIYAGGAVGGLIRDWCDARVPTLRAQNARALEAWRQAMDLPLIESRVKAIIGERTANIDASIEAQREPLYAQLDAASKNPASDCQGLEAYLNAQVNLKKQYANEYAIVAARAATATASAGTGSAPVPSTGSAPVPSTGSAPVSSAGSAPVSSAGSTPVGSAPPSTPTTSTASAPKLPVMPPFDYVQYAKLKLDPEKEPVLDEYHCYAEVRGEKYAAHNLTLQILAGHKYRVGVGTAVAEGEFRTERYDLFFTSGALASKEKHFYVFKRYEGAEIWIYNLGSGDNKIDFRCYQRGGAEQLQQLKFKRKDPQPGSYPCVTADGSNKSLGALEILPNRRYRYQGGEGGYAANITGELGRSYSNLDFTGGVLNGGSSSYEEDQTGRQEYSFYRPKIECARQVAPRPLPKFGPAKAPPAPGSGGLEGRYFYGRQQFIDLNNNLACQGICYDYLIFQKDGYVYSDDLEDTEGTQDADCSRTYPSGFPVCQTYTVKGNTLQIGLEKPQTFAKSKSGLKIGSDGWSVLEPLDGLKFNLPYYSQRISGAIIGTGGGSSSVNLALRKDGRFSRESSSSFFYGATDNAAPTGNVIASVSGSSSRSNNGSYRVYGNTIEFKYDDGRVVKQFMFLPSGRTDLTFLHIGGSIYWEDKKK